MKISLNQVLAGLLLVSGGGWVNEAAGAVPGIVFLEAEQFADGLEQR